MNPNVGLEAASGLVSFLLKTTLEWLVCLALVRLATSARWRFNLWLALLVAFVAQWFWMWVDVARSQFAPAAVLAGAAGHQRTVWNAISVAPQFARELTQVLLGLLGLYLVVLLWRGVGAIMARLRLARAMRFRRAPAESLASAFAEVVGEAQAQGRDFTDCELWVLPGINSPAIVGLLRPFVVVPIACETQDKAELRAAFWHELKHVQRRDALWSFLVGTSRALLWFHPAVRQGSRALHAQRELACDAAVVQEHPHSRDVYASCLVHFARTSAQPALPAIEMASRPSLLAMRVRSILEETPGIGRFARAGRSTANLLLVAATIAVVPAIHVLFAMQIRIPLVQMPVTNVTASDVVLRANGHAVRRGPRPAGAIVDRIFSPQALRHAISIPHDSSLAAEHRAGMEVLTESTGMDAPAPEDQQVILDSRLGPPPHAPVPNSWGTVAVDAAERIALIPDHDGDRH